MRWKISQLACNATAAQFMEDELDRSFPLEMGASGITLLTEKHHTSVPAAEITKGLLTYRSRLPRLSSDGGSSTPAVEGGAPPWKTALPTCRCSIEGYS